MVTGFFKKYQHFTKAECDFLMFLSVAILVTFKQKLKSFKNHKNSTNFTDNA